MSLNDIGEETCHEEDHEDPPPEGTVDVDKGAVPFVKLRSFSRQAFCWVMNWDIHYFLPLATTWFSTELANWVTRFYMKCPF